ncbi:MAG TPA: sodium:calcium symporter [Planctomycetota bacterium]|nr:MAG: Sodium:neurotransmitter symporter family protein [Planctomycetes bacterium ADurb.Bin069]HNS00424.1 sodium:calcium symporter [Planctomycetota bacterium]HNU26971.1 sodium:calcium symporter [Planctomycetota bacterium]HOE31346.1 sodium:calcium symporter [Planctomycetota bacterium]HOE88257.1 sodium:calcium symporter [Planctomycetota bacterium]
MDGTGGRRKEHWGTHVGMILAVAGSAVGLGNFLRFPGVAAQNGGGTFMIPYFCAFILLGLPICWAEWTMGKYGGMFGFNSCPAIFGAIGRRRTWRYIGVLGILVPMGILMYYLLIESWCLGYAVSYLFGMIDLGPDPAAWAQRSGEHFTRFVGADRDGIMLDGSIHPSVVFWVLTFTVNFFLIFRGLEKGIEKVCTWGIPLMAICAFIVLARVLSLGTPDPAQPDRNVLNGLGFMWNPKPVAGEEPWYVVLANPQVWMSAASQIFFSLSVGFGVIINYASYLRRRDDVVLSGLTASSINEFFEVCLGGLITIPAAFVFLGVAFPMDSSFDLGFKTLPVVFMHMKFGSLFGFLWFFMLFLAAITSSLSMLQPAIAFLEEALGIGRRASVAILGLASVGGSLFIIYFSKNLSALDTMDFWVGTALIFVFATCQVVLYAWVLGVEKGAVIAAEGAELRQPRVFKFIVKYVSPVYLLAVFVMWCSIKLPGYVKDLADGGVPLLTVGMIAGLAIFLLLLISVGGSRWHAETRPEPRLGDVERLSREEVKDWEGAI